MIRDLRSEIEFLTGIQDFLQQNPGAGFFTCTYTHRLSLFGSQLKYYSALGSNCNKVSDTMSIICEIYIHVAYNCCYALVCGSANPIRGFMNVLGDGNAVSDALDSSCALQPCCKIVSNSSWPFFFFHNRKPPEFSY